MNSNALSSPGTKSVARDPVTEVGQIPFALCEIVAIAEASGQAEIATLADSILNLILGCGSLKILELPQVAREEIAAIIVNYQVESRST